MRRRDALGTFAGLASAMLAGHPALAKQTGAPVFGVNDPSKYNDAPNAHGGAGVLRYMELLGSDVFQSNYLFFHRGVLPPKTSIGEHIHRHMEEMYFIFDGIAQFTVNGRTAVLPGPAMVLCPRGSSHGIYNHTDRPVEWMNVAVSDVKGKGDAVDYGDDLTSKTPESPVPFAHAFLDPRITARITSRGAHGGKGNINFKRLWARDSFLTPWNFVDYCILPPDTSIGYHQHIPIEEVYYVVSGHGRSTVNDVTWDVGPHTAIPCTIYDMHGIYNSGDTELVLINFAVRTGVTPGQGEPVHVDDDLSTR